jgi:predicted ATPase
MIHLHSIARRPGDAPTNQFPFSVPVVRDLHTLEFTAEVTFFVGENGSGKSTLLEAIAAAAGLPTAGSQDTRRDPTLVAQRRLADALRLAWHRKATRGFFLRAEDFFGFTRSVAKMRAEFLAELDEIAVDYAGASAKARALREGPVRASLQAMESRYGADLDASSHGQSFLTLFRSRFVPGGLYLLDEPEAPLSPQSQLALLAMMKDMVAQDAQFVIATHSPILLAFPGAAIYSFDVSPLAPVAYAELEHVNLTRDFLANPERFLRHL